MFRTWIERWRLVPDGEPLATPLARLLPVRRDGAPAMLRIADGEERRRGAALMAWWAGDGAARVLARDGTALLLERATGGGALADMAREGQDDDACRILCATAARLHRPRALPPPELVPLGVWFRALESAAARHGGLLVRSAQAARGLLAEPCRLRVLHGDLHHGNVLDFVARGWLAIDPKGLLGEPGFDLANLFINPDLADPARPVASVPGRLARRVAVVAAAADLEPRRLLLWILAWAGLSAAWFMEDGDDTRAAIALALARLAAGELDR
ncbi:APH(6) family putative aminoglycoside O-phosphotransferase [Ancylobacter sp. 6x-1]|uniref:APH(6) family putative aminoglycoside O-phosphotransferase n=1 Tax=Ancylobacter crimeensis TaxID=2579147 RepID=A0ABT0DBW4_9HYPH|nr:aminoglycoside phosphotransferase family protein [Ancylobacter crimeensis]MCK0197452.1 APH(6) family putative aminoglycoside O-phosphotransferase [Ancylobacter crimeensis]